MKVRVAGSYNVSSDIEVIILSMYLYVLFQRELIIVMFDWVFL